MKHLLALFGFLVVLVYLMFALVQGTLESHTDVADGMGYQDKNKDNVTDAPDIVMQVEGGNFSAIYFFRESDFAEHWDFKVTSSLPVDVMVCDDSGTEMFHYRGVERICFSMPWRWDTQILVFERHDPGTASISVWLDRNE